MYTGKRFVHEKAILSLRPTASTVGFDAHHGSRIAPTPIPALNGAQKLLYFAIEHCRFFEVDGMSSPRLDE
jgi:hypothetical protein